MVQGGERGEVVRRCKAARAWARWRVGGVVSRARWRAVQGGERGSGERGSSEQGRGGERVLGGERGEAASGARGGAVILGEGSVLNIGCGEKSV